MAVQWYNLATLIDEAKEILTHQNTNPQPVSTTKQKKQMNNDNTPLRFDLSTDATLIKVSIKQYSGRKKDDTLSAQAAAANRADADAIETYLTSLEKADKAAIQKVATKARDHLNFHTAMWDTGWRLVANTRYEAMRSELEAFGLEFSTEVENLVQRHSELEKKAKAALGPILFARIGFPSEAELRSAYEFKIDRQAIVNPADIRLRHVSSNAVKEFERAAREQQAEKVADAMRQLVSRLMEIVVRIKDTLSDEDAIFRDTMITNVQDLCGIIPSLNLTGDTFISRTADEIRGTLGSLNPKVLREDKEARKEAAKLASSFADKLSKMKVTNDI